MKKTMTNYENYRKAVDKEMQGCCHISDQSKEIKKAYRIRFDEIDAVVRPFIKLQRKDKAAYESILQYCGLCKQVREGTLTPIK